MKVSPSGSVGLPRRRGGTGADLRARAPKAAQAQADACAILSVRLRPIASSGRIRHDCASDHMVRRWRNYVLLLRPGLRKIIIWRTPRAAVSRIGEERGGEQGMHTVQKTTGRYLASNGAGSCCASSRDLPAASRWAAWRVNRRVPIASDGRSPFNGVAGFTERVSAQVLLRPGSPMVSVRAVSGFGAKLGHAGGHAQRARGLTSSAARMLVRSAHISGDKNSGKAKLAAGAVTRPEQLAQVFCARPDHKRSGGGRRLRATGPEEISRLAPGCRPPRRGRTSDAPVPFVFAGQPAGGSAERSPSGTRVQRLSAEPESSSVPSFQRGLRFRRPSH